MSSQYIKCSSLKSKARTVKSQLSETISRGLSNCRGNILVQAGRLWRPQVVVQVCGCFAGAGAPAKHPQTCIKGQFAAQPQHVCEYCPHCLRSLEIGHKCMPN